MDRKEAWIALDLIPGIGPRTTSRLLEVFGAPEAVLCAKPAVIRTLDFLKTPQREALLTGVDKKAVHQVMTSLEQIGAQALCRDDKAYPAQLSEIPDPPNVLYVKGSLADLQPAVAMVGTRAPSHYGREVAFSLARDLSRRGIAVVSGLARGIDTQAHLGALQGATKTVAVLGSGLAQMYPPENLRLSEEISQRGAVVTEFPPGTGPRPENFPRRNRIISGLSAGVIVIEATVQSGAMITARCALEQGRTVLAVPGSITNIRAHGPHHLLRHGAVLVESADDVIVEIAPQVKQVLKQEQRTTEHGIVEIIAGGALSIEEIATAMNKDVTVITREVSMLELQGELSRVEGNRFTRRSIHG